MATTKKADLVGEPDRVIHKTVQSAIVAFQAECGPIYKSKKHQQGYKFAQLEDWVDVVKPVLERHGLAVLVSFTDCQDVGEYKTSTSVWTRTRVKARATVIHAESDETLVIEGYGEGADPSDKGVYKAQTGARKYLLAAITGSATTDDPEFETRDQDRKPDRAPAKPPAQPSHDHETTNSPASGSVSLVQAQDCWKLFRVRCQQVLPPETDAKAVEAYFRDLLGRSLGVHSTKDIPRRRLAEFTKLIQAWLPDEVVQGDGSEAPY